MHTHDLPVIAIDGPSASGKGTVAQLVANTLGFHYLDSGALYRLVALKTMQTKIDISLLNKLAEIARNLDVIFEDNKILLEDNDVTNAIRTEECGILASKLASYPPIRAALTERQRAFCRTPGLVADGRDMGSVIFPNAPLKIFLTASAEVRAQRRYKQLIEKGINANIADLLQDIQKRDARDSNRSVAPLQQGTDARLLDTTSLSITQAKDTVLAWYTEICTNK
jgi:CMP/dCMP kinase